MRREWCCHSLFSIWAAVFAMEAVGLREKLIGVVYEVAAELGYMIYEAGVLLRGGSSRIIVKIDSLGGISHRDCEEFSRSLSGTLDELRLLPNYSVEVSSPGLRRSLRKTEEFVRFKGAPVKIVYRDGDVHRVFKGIIAGVSEAAVTINSEGRELKLEMGFIKSANLEY